MRLMIVLFAFMTAACAATATRTTVANEPRTNTAAPQWYLDDIAFMTRDGGKWATSNARYQSQDEPMQAYAMIWTAGINSETMTGRMYGIIDSKETSDFWRFRQYWHPGRGEAVVEQFGAGGAFGVGVMWREAGGAKMDQTFYGADGSPSRTGHKSHNTENGAHITESFDIVGETWKPNRSYTWRRVTVSGNEN